MSPADQRQVEALLRAIAAVVPTRYGGMHPNLIHLYDVAQAMRNGLDPDVEPAAPRAALDAGLAGELLVELTALLDVGEAVHSAASSWLELDPTDGRRHDERRAHGQQGYEANAAELARSCRQTLAILDVGE